MRRKGLLGLFVAAILLTGCGDGDDGGGDDAQTEEAQQVVTDMIAAYRDKDFEQVCELADQRGSDSIAKITKQDTCAEGYVELFEKQSQYAGVPGTPFDDYLDTLGEYTVGDVELQDDGSAHVSLEGPIDGVIAIVVEEDGEFRVSELFVTPDAASSPGTGLGQEGGGAQGEVQVQP